ALDCELVLLTKAEDVGDLVERAPNAEIVICNLPNRAARLAWEQSLLPGKIKRIAPDLLHSPHYSMPYVTGTPVVAVMHDATFWLHPGAHESHKRIWFKTVSRLTARRAERLITVSNAAKNDLVEVGIPAEKLDVVYHGVDDSWFDLETHGGDYLFFVGTLEPRKNLPRLLRAYRESGLDLELRLAGAMGWKTDELESEIAKTPGVKLLGYVSDAEKREQMAGARAFVYPSLSEGFGIPILEAMAAGIPVVTSNASATAEVAGDAALTTDPLDTSALSEALIAAATDESTRARLSLAGPRRASEFTWARAAKATAETWRLALEGHR
ncbi:MAG: hypothetical protein DCC49_13780, partial [Acidobacteria bacterium]